MCAAEPDPRRDATVAAIEQVMPSVVNIATETIIERDDPYQDLLRQFFGWRGPSLRREKSYSLGSGVIIDEEGHLLTNFHVVNSATRIQVKLWDGREYEAEPLVATPGSDIALLKIKAKPGERFKAIRFAADDDLLLGETVLALGNPYGLGGSVTKGILSAKNRRPATGDDALGVQDWLVTDATINPGNSGGPLVNLRGELIGLNVAVHREQQGMGIGFAIPVKQVSAALAHFFTPEVMDSLAFGAELKAGPGPLVVTAVQPGGPAAKAGLREGDRVEQVNGQSPAGLIAFARLVGAASSQEARLVVLRGSERRRIVVGLLSFEDLIRQKLGLKLATQVTQFPGIGAGSGLKIEEVEKDGPASRAQLQRDYVLTGLEGRGVGDLRTVAELLETKKPGDAVRLTLVAPREIGAGYVEFRQGTIELPVR